MRVRAEGDDRVIGGEARDLALEVHLGAVEPERARDLEAGSELGLVDRRAGLNEITGVVVSFVAGGVEGSLRVFEKSDDPRAHYECQRVFSVNDADRGGSGAEGGKALWDRVRGGAASNQLQRVEKSTTGPEPADGAALALLALGDACVGRIKMFSENGFSKLWNACSRRP